MYLVTIMDWASRKVLSWRLSNTMDTSFCLEALEEAIEQFVCPEIVANMPHQTEVVVYEPCDDGWSVLEEASSKDAQDFKFWVKCRLRTAR